MPTLFALAGVGLAIGAVVLDEALSEGWTLPLSVASTPDSARSVLSTVASATMTFAGIAFSVTLLVFQMSSSQYSPRVIHGLFRDGFNKRIIGLVVGTFTYCLVVLRSVHGPVDGGPDATVPTLSVSLAVLLGVVAVLGIVGFIDHNAHHMDVSRILGRVTRDARDRAGARWWPQDATPPADDRTAGPPVGLHTVVASDRDGWVQHVDPGRLLSAVPDGGTLDVDVGPGRYVVRGGVLARVWPAAEGDARDRLEAAVRGAVVLGDSRTTTQDPAYALRQMVDVALKALSPGVNDPTTAQDAVFHLAEALRAVLTAGAPPDELRRDGGRVLLRVWNGPELVELAFAEVRRAAAPHPTAVDYVLAAIEMVARTTGDVADADAVHTELRRQAQLAVADAEHAGVPTWDVDALRRRLDELALG